MLGGHSYHSLVPVIGVNHLVVVAEPNFRVLNAVDGCRPVVGIFILVPAAVFQFLPAHNHPVGIGLAGDVLLGSPAALKLPAGHGYDVHLETGVALLFPDLNPPIGGALGDPGILLLGNYQQVYVRMFPPVTPGPGAKQDYHRRAGGVLGSLSRGQTGCVRRPLAIRIFHLCLHGNPAPGIGQFAATELSMIAAAIVNGRLGLRSPSEAIAAAKLPLTAAAA